MREKSNRIKKRVENTEACIKSHLDEEKSCFKLLKKSKLSQVVPLLNLNIKRYKCFV